MNREDIKKVIPHREPMLLVDEVELLEDGSSVGYYTVRGDEFFLQGHFPGNPIVPGVILCEMCAQSSAAMFAVDTEGKTPLYTGINNVRFKNQVKPGDRIRFCCRVDRVKKPFYFIHGEAFVGDKLCMSGDFSFAIV